MKKHSLSLIALIALFTPGTLIAQSQSSAIPDRISYQGIITDASGNLIATAAPENHEVIFRIWNHPTDSDLDENLIYSEKQVLTVSNGEFSALVGAGANVTGEEAQGPGTIQVSEVFGGEQRYLGVTVAAAAAIAASDLEVSPRQQLVSTAFAFRAKEAEAVLDNSIGTESIANSSITLAKIAPGAVDNSVVAAGIAASKLGTGTVDNSELSHLDGVTSGIQSQINTISTSANGKAGLITNNVFTGTNQMPTLGLGTTPGDIPLTTSTSGTSAIGNTANFLWPGTRNSHVHWGTNGDWYIRSGKAAGVVYIQDVGGAVLIGNSNNAHVGIGVFPTKGRLHVGTETFNTGFIDYRLYGIGGQFNSRNELSTSIFAQNTIAAEDFVAFSDARIKKSQGRSDAAEDLETINNLIVTDYSHIDEVIHGSGMTKKLIAQEVNSVFPQATSKSTDVIPDIFEMAKVNQGWVELDTDLKKGDRVRLLLENETKMYEIAEVKEGQFRTTEFLDGVKVFVYGREVDDFLSIDYDAISMLNVSATQEIYRRLEAKEKEVAALEARLVALESKDRSRDAKMAAIEKLLGRNSQTASVSYQLAE